MKRLAILQNADFEGPGRLPAWAADEGFSVECYAAFRGELPELSSFSHLVVLGTPHSVHEIGEVPWLERVKELVAGALAAELPVLGICFGAQLLAHLLGARVAVGERAEIGWHAFPAEVAPAGYTGLGEGKLFQWHREFFELPVGCEGFGKSAAGYLAGFARGGKLLGLSGHIEMNPALVEAYIARCWDEAGHAQELASGRAAFRQAPAAMRMDAATSGSDALARELFLRWLHSV